MSINTVGVEYEGGQCSRAVQVTDANDLLDIGMGQYIMDHVPEQIYYVPGKCGLECSDGTGKVWRNCEGWAAGNKSGTGNNKKKKIPLTTILIIAAIAGIIILIVIKKKK